MSLTITNNYYNKYMKYKNKYLYLQQLINNHNEIDNNEINGGMGSFSFLKKKTKSTTPALAPTAPTTSALTFPVFYPFFTIVLKSIADENDKEIIHNIYKLYIEMGNDKIAI